jgi:hypothetical protein
LTDVSAFEEMLPEIVRARMGTCAAQSGTIDSGRPIDVGDGPEWAEGQGCLMIEGQGKAAAQDMPIARGWVDSPVGTTAQEGRGGAAGRDSIPLVEPRSSAFARAPSSVGESLTQDEITPDLGATCVERRVAAEKFASAEVDEGRVWPHWLQDVDVLPRPPGYRRPPPPCVRKEGHVLIPLEDIPDQDWSFAGPEEELAYWLSVLERIRQGDLPEDEQEVLNGPDPTPPCCITTGRVRPVEKEDVVDPRGDIHIQGGGRGADPVTSGPPTAGSVRLRTRPQLDEISADLTPIAPSRVLIVYGVPTTGQRKQSGSRRGAHARGLRQINSGVSRPRTGSSC